jgi:hypothetical protein
MTSIAHDTDATPDVTVDLLAAAEHIERYGLAKGDFFDPDDPDNKRVCSLGAIAIVTTPAGQLYEVETVDCEPAAVAFLEYLFLTVPDLAFKYERGMPDDGADMALALAGVSLIETVGAWNDEPARTAARWAGEQ